MHFSLNSIKSLPNFATLQASNNPNNENLKGLFQIKSYRIYIYKKEDKESKKNDYLLNWRSIEEAPWKPTTNIKKIQKDIIAFEKEMNNQSIKSQNMISKNYGKLEEGDIAEEILGISKKNNVIFAFIRWKTNKNGIRPMDSFVSTKILKEYDPLILINFYEKKLKI